LSRNRPVWIAIGALAIGAPPSLAQDAVQDAQEGERLESLDELLGLEEGGSGEEERGELPDAAQAELERELSQQEAAEAFEQAAMLMGETAARLGDLNDTGLATQRLQEDILRKLDAVIEAAKNNQQQSQSSSSSSSEQNQQPNQPQQQQQQQQGEASQGDNKDENMPPGRQDGQLNPEIDSARAAWGALPERVRDALFQGRSDRYSSLYERLTEAYYRRLAEERQP